MRILFVSNLFPSASEPIRGLDNAVLLEKLKVLHGCEVRVVSPRAILPGGKFDLSIRAGDEWCSPKFIPAFYVPKVGGLMNAGLMMRALCGEMDQILHEWKPDCILSSWLFPDGCAVERVLRARVDRPPLVQITQGTDTHSYLKSRWRRKQIVRSLNSVVTKSVICRSADLGNQLMAAGVDAEKLNTIYNGVDERVFFTRKERSITETKLLLFVGNLLPVKNPELLLAAHRALNQRRRHKALEPVVLRLVGDGPMRSSLEELVQSTTESQTVEFLGRQAPETVGELMRESSVLCLSSHNEGFPNVILEAMACGLPVVSTNVGGISELISSRERGVLVPPNDVNAFADALELLLDKDQEMRDGSEQDRPDLSWQRAAREYYQILCEATNSGTSNE